MTKAHQALGDLAAIDRFRAWAAVNWTYRVGCVDAATRSQFLEVARSTANWDAAVAPAQACPTNTRVVNVRDPTWIVIAGNVYAVPNPTVGQTAFDSCMSSGTANGTVCLPLQAGAIRSDAEARFTQAIASVFAGQATIDQAFTTGNLWILVNPPPPAFAAKFLGATGQDYVGGLQATPDGIPDWHIQLAGLKSAPIQVKITSPTATDASAGEWDFPSDGSHYVISIMGNDLFFEPYMTPRTFHVQVTYADMTTDQADTLAPAQ
jgi:hypothetical protein